MPESPKQIKSKKSSVENANEEYYFMNGLEDETKEIKMPQSQIDSATKKEKRINIKRRVIGNYFIEKSIGEGTFGKVKLGTHTLTGQKVAIKILEKDRITDVSDVERVAREIHILKMIRHPNIIQLYEIIETPK